MYRTFTVTETIIWHTGFGVGILVIYIYKFWIDGIVIQESLDIFQHKREDGKNFDK